MEYLTGYTVKPHEVTATGEALFTDGRDTGLKVNQVTCEAYGYTYDKTSGTCRAFRYNTNLERNINNINNKNNGSGNTNELGSNTIQINGTQNTTKGFNNNCFINGSANEIANGVNNATVLGSKGEATATNSIVLGGNAAADSLGERQTITVMYGTTTDDNSTVNSYLNNTVDSYFVVPDNTIIAFHTETVAVRVGGTGAGSLGDFKAIVEIGAVINESGTLSIDKSRTVIANVGTTSGWISDIGVSGTNLIQQVKGANNRDLMWTTTIRMTQIKTGVAL
jgi:hypothetical protein|tara:strand:+ start:578 stop:1417 length:840 start_codon:yes stop_codon:yes gene_type:complete